MSQTPSARSDDPGRITSFDRKVRVPDRVLGREIDGELVILHLDRGTYFGLDPVGASIWRQLRESPTVRDAFEALLAEFAVEPEALRRDLERLVGELVEEDLVELESPATVLAGPPPVEAGEEIR